MNKFEKPMIFFSTLLYPLYTLPWVIKAMIKNEYFGYILFSLAMAFFAYIMIPYDTMDITRYYEIFEKLKYVNFDEIYDTVNGGIFRFSFFIYVWVLAKIGLVKQFLPFSIVFIVFMLYFTILRKLRVTLTRNATFGQLAYVSFVGVALLINELRFMEPASGLRNALAFALFSYGLAELLIFGKNRILFLIFSFLAMTIHISTLPLFLIALISIATPKNTWIRTLFIISMILVFFGVGSYIFYGIMGLMKPLLVSHSLYFPSYMEPDGIWGGGYYIGKSIKTIVYEKYIKIFPFYFSGLYLYFYGKKINTRLINFLMLTFIFITLVSVSRTLLDRYSYFFTTFFIYAIILDLQLDILTKYKKILISLLIFSMIMMDFGSMVKYRDIFVSSWYKTLYIPAPFLMLKSISKKDYIIRESL